MRSVIKDYNYLHSELCHLILDIFDFFHRQSVSAQLNQRMNWFVRMLVSARDISLAVEHSQEVLDRVTTKIKNEPCLP